MEFEEKLKRVSEIGHIRMCDASSEEHEEYWRLLDEIVKESLAKVKEMDK